MKYLQGLFMVSKNVLYGSAGAAVGTWLLAYYFVSNEIDKSSSIVRQTLFNINATNEFKNDIALPVKTSSNIRGKMNQFKGLANIDFDVTDDKNGNNSYNFIIMIYSI